MSGPGWLMGSLMVLVGVAIIASIIYSFVRVTRTPEQSGLGIIRAMLALVLVGGLVILAGASFSMGDIQTRNLLVGGLVASSAAAVAFYFASRDADNARRDLLNATLGTESVPKLEGLKVSQAQAAMSSGSLVLKLPEPVPGPDDTITKQDIAAGTSVPKGTVVPVTV
jgi:PASTA domain-containing protein